MKIDKIQTANYKNPNFGVLKINKAGQAALKDISFNRKELLRSIGCSAEVRKSRFYDLVLGIGGKLFIQAKKGSTFIKDNDLYQKDKDAVVYVNETEPELKTIVENLRTQIKQRLDLGFATKEEASELAEELRAIEPQNQDFHTTLALFKALEAAESYKQVLDETLENYFVEE